MDTSAFQKRFVAIDPGASGGIAWRTEEGSVKAEKMPSTEGDIVSFLRGFKTSTHSFIMEEVGGYIGRAQPGSAMFKFGRHTGFVIGVIMTLGFRLDLVRPQKWQKALSLGTSKDCASKTEWKNKLKSVAQRKFPEIEVTLATADALLILDYAENA